MRLYRAMIHSVQRVEANCRLTARKQQMKCACGKLAAFSFPAYSIMYPTPRIVRITSSDVFCRMYRTYTSMMFVSP